MNLILIIMDTLRKDHVGAYGNQWIQTPHMDAFARESVLFTRCYPESLPTLPHRRAMHTGLRTYPYHGHHDFKGDFSGAPGWGPIPEEQNTIAEMFGQAGYRTALITDCYHQFKPSKNFHRGFNEWIWLRGQEGDPYRSGPVVSDEQIARHMVEDPADNPGLAHFLRVYLGNNVILPLHFKNLIGPIVPRSVRRSTRLRIESPASVVDCVAALSGWHAVHLPR